MARLLAVGMILVAVLGSGWAAGTWTGRWGNPRAVQEATARLEQVPFTLGDAWDGQPGVEMTEQEIAIAEISGYISRRYVHRTTGSIVSVLLLCGRSGPVSVHTPEICYVGAGFAQTKASATVDGREGAWQVQVRDFQKVNVASPTMLRVMFAWGCEGKWSVPSNPRFTFSRKPYLYKLYVVREMANPEEDLQGDPVRELLDDLMPRLQETLFPST
jgi:hypothetical protein